MLAAPERLSQAAVDLLETPENEIFLSAASCWEIAIKHQLGKLLLPGPPHDYVPDRMLASGVSGLPVEVRHAVAVAELPTHHRDPFDRLLIAQATLESMPILTADPQLRRYGIETIDA